MSRKFDIVCVGAAVVDIPLRPVSEELFKVESWPVTNIAMTPGGDALNEATILSRLGQKVELISMVGDDIAGSFIEDHCKKEGIDIRGLRIKEGVDTSINIGMVTESGSRTFITNRNASLWKMSLEDLDLSLIKEAGILSLGSFFNNPLLDTKALVRIFKEAKAQKLTICADTIVPRFNERIDDIAEALGYVDYFFANDEEALIITEGKSIEDAAARLAQAGAKHVIIKIGKQGCYLYARNEEPFIVPAVPGIEAIDTIGAGDNFAAGFICGLSEGKDLKECAAMANAAASICIQSSGACGGLHHREQISEQLRRYKTMQQES